MKDNSTKIAVLEEAMKNVGKRFDSVDKGFDEVNLSIKELALRIDRYSDDMTKAFDKHTRDDEKKFASKHELYILTERVENNEQKDAQIANSIRWAVLAIIGMVITAIGKVILK